MNTINTGFKEIDSIIGDLQGGDLCVIGGHPSIGKTSFVADIAKYNAIKKNNKVLIFSLQHTKKNMIAKMKNSFKKISEEGFYLNFQEKNDKDLLIISDDTYDIDSILIEMPQCIPKLIIIDYLQLIESKQKFGSRNYELDYVLRQLKKAAKNSGIPIIITSAVTDYNEKTFKNVESLEDIADVIMFIEDVPLSEINEKKISITKNPMGKVGSIKLIFTVTDPLVQD